MNECNQCLLYLCPCHDRLSEFRSGRGDRGGTGDAAVNCAVVDGCNFDKELDPDAGSVRETVLGL